MINSGNYTPLGLNTLGSLMSNVGLRISPRMSSYVGTSDATNSFTIGSLFDTPIPTLNVAKDYTVLAKDSPYYTSILQIGNTTIPALVNSKPSTYTRTFSGNLAQFGFLRLLALEAYNQLHLNNGSYSDFLSTFTMASSFINQHNKAIDGFAATDSFLKGSFSNMNDLVTGDIAGVSISCFYFGQDLIASGRSIDLSNIDTFGTPVNLLKTINKNKAFTKAFNIALLSAGFSNDDVTRMLTTNNVTVDEQKRLYAAFMLVMGKDLSDVCVILNCQTEKLDTLADLLNPIKLFPRSYKTLTVPVFNTMPGPTNSKIYYPIYSGTDTNGYVLQMFGEKLRTILPDSLAASCNAFSFSMMQIKNIKSMNIEKFSQVVRNLETTSDLNVGATDVPGNTDVAKNALTQLAKGSGESGRYTYCDLFGCVSSVIYEFEKLKQLIEKLQTPALYSACVALKNELASNLSSGQIPALINNINSELQSIKTSNLSVATELNLLYESIGKQLQREQETRELAFGDTSLITSSNTDVMGFINSLQQHATKTEQHGPVHVLEAIANTDNIGGNSLIGGMREIRNGVRMGLTGAEQDNSVVKPQLLLPRSNKSTCPCQKGPLMNVVMETGGPLVRGPFLGSLGTSRETNLIPKNLDVCAMSDIVNTGGILNTDQAIAEVEKCNCDCWDTIQ